MRKIQIETHDGQSDIVEVEEYDALQTAAEINNSQEEHVIAFGDYIYSKINIKTVKPVVEENEDTEEGAE